MANVTKISLDGTPYDIADASARSTASKAQTTANTANTTAGQAKTAAATAQANANTIASKAVTVKYNSEATSLVITTGIDLS